MTVLLATLLATPAMAERFTIAAAADLRFALDEIVELFGVRYPEHDINVIYGSSGRMTAQIVNGAPFDIFFSADIAYPRLLHAEGLTVTEPEVYATGRIVIWSTSFDASSFSLQDLLREDIRRIAIAQPDHAPYGQRAREALQSAGIWEQVQPRLVFGENISHAAQMTESGAADVGIIALSLALFPALQAHGHSLISETAHEPLTQGFVITRRGAGKHGVQRFADFMGSDEVHAIMEAYGFQMPGRE